MLSPIDRTRLEKAATDNGFDLEGATDGPWLSFASSQTSLTPALERASQR